MSYYMSLHLVFIYYAVESQLASLSDPVWVIYISGGDLNSGLCKERLTSLISAQEKGLKVRLRELFWQVFKKEPDLTTVGQGPR